MTDRWTLFAGDVRERLADIEDETAQTAVTSPPYWQLRDYGHADQLGLEPTPDEFVANIVGVFREVRRVLRDDGTLWLNLGDTYLGGRCGGQGRSGLTSERNHEATRAVRAAVGGAAHKTAPGLVRKNLVGIPWRVALALQADGWILRSEIIWHKPSVMPASVADRPTCDHEHVFLLSKHPRYYYDANAIRERAVDPKYSTPQSGARAFSRLRSDDPSRSQRAAAPVVSKEADGRRNKRTVWSIPQEPTRSAHTSTFPRGLVRPCVLAGAPAGAVVLDPFAGVGTTGVEAMALGRRFLGIELVHFEEARGNLRRAESQQLLPLQEASV